MIIILVGISILIALFIWYISYSATTDISQDPSFKEYINTPLIVKQPSALKQSAENLNRFSSYYIETYSEETFQIDKNVLKKYNVGDTIFFTSAKKFFSNHVGNSYYLQGKEKLNNGEVIEFQYSVSKYQPIIWETLDEFLERKKAEKNTIESPY